MIGVNCKVYCTHFAAEYTTKTHMSSWVILLGIVHCIVYSVHQSKYMELYSEECTDCTSAMYFIIYPSSTTLVDWVEYSVDKSLHDPLVEIAKLVGYWTERQKYKDT